MIKRTVIDTIKKYNATFVTETAHLKAAFSHNHLRLWRVSIKRYKTLSDFAGGIQKKTIEKELKILYKKGGTARKRRLNQKKSKKLFSTLTKKEYKAFIVFCNKKTLRAQKVFEKKISRYDVSIHNEKYKKIISFFNKTTKVDLLKKYELFKRQIINHINTILTKKKITEEDLHDIRKEAKHLLYFSNLFNDKGIKEYKVISKLLGRWNDAIELHISLKERNEKYGSTHVKKIIKNHKKEILKQKKTILSHLINHFAS